VVTWARSFGLPLGDSHEGRIIGQFALHVRNFWDLGPSGSSFGAAWQPFSDVPYTHHPPLLTGIHLVVSTVLGQGLWQLKAVSYLAGLTTVPALYWVGRRMGFGALPVAAATGALVATPWWWVYGRLGLGFLPNLAMVGMVLLVADEANNRGLRRAAVATGAAVAASWHGAFLAPLLWLWLWRRRGLDRTVAVVGAAVGVGALAMLVWVTQGGGVSELADHAGTRMGVDRTVGEFLDRQWMFARGLLPAWYLVLVLPALVAGLADSRSRALTGMLATMVVVFAVVPSDNAWVHDYWNFPVLMALFPGFAALVDRVVRALPGLRRGAAEGAVAVLVAAALVVLAPGANHERYFAAPAEAGRLVEAVGPAAGQDTAWHTPQVPWPTWVSRAWGLEPSVVASSEDVATVGDYDRVVVRLDRLPSFVDRSVADEALAVRGTYAVVTGVALRRHLLSE
jgi:MFS family permease